MRIPIIRLLLFAMTLYTNHTLADDIVLKLGDNALPASVFPSSLLSLPFEPGEEVRLVNPDAGIVRDFGPKKNAVIGSELWTFDRDTGQMLGVAGTELTPGSTVAGSACPAGCEGITQNVFYFGSTLGFVAPYFGSDAGNMYGPALLRRISPARLEVFFEVLELQWSDIHVVLGRANNQGVTVQCNADSAVGYRCHMEHLIQPEEDLDNTGLAGNTFQMEFTMSESQALHVSIGGDYLRDRTIECPGPDGTILSLTAQAELPGGASIQSVTWTRNGQVIGTTLSINPRITLGSYTFEAIIVTDQGQQGRSRATITMVDTIPPTLIAGFKDTATGKFIQRLVSPQVFSSVELSLEATDVCDPAPKITSIHLDPSYGARNGERFSYPGTASIPSLSTLIPFEPNAINLEATAEDASGNSTHASSLLRVLF